MVSEKQFLSPLLATTEHASEIYFTGYTLRRVRIALLTTEREYCFNPHIATLRVLRKPISLHSYEFTSKAAQRRIPCKRPDPLCHRRHRYHTQKLLRPLLISYCLARTAGRKREWSEITVCLCSQADN